MTIEQIVDIPASRRLVIEVPAEVPAGRTVLAFTPVPGGVEKSEVRDLFSYRTGFLKGQVSVPPDFDTMGRTEIAALFGENP
jgi:hypothetical protein